MEDTNTTQSDGRQPLWKQLLGAIIGGGLALSLYYGYEFAKPKVTAYLTLPPADRMYDLGSSHIADKTTDEGNRKRLLSRNARVAEQLGANASADELLDSVDDHSMDIAWPGHDPENPKYTEVTGIVPEEDGESEEPAMAEVTEQEDTDMVVNNRLFEQEMATKEMTTEDNWDSLWGDIRSRETAPQQAEHVDAEALPDTGFGLGFVVAGAAGGALASTRRKRKMS